MSFSLIRPDSPLDQISQREGLPAEAELAGLSLSDQALLKQVLASPVDYVPDPIFRRSDAYKKLFEEITPIPVPNTSWYHPVMEDASSDAARSLVNVVLTAEQERSLFLQFNYTRFRVAQLHKQMEGKPLALKPAKELLYWHQASMRLRDQIAQFNLALVLAMAKRVRMSDMDFGDLISEGNMALLRAIDKFNVARGFKFSTYACRAILKAFSRSGVKHSRYRQLFPTDFDPALERSDYVRRRFDQHEEDCAGEVRRIVETNQAELTDMEQTVINHRFAINAPQPDSSPLTLEQVGQLVGLTKERVRQIQNKALEKIRHTLEERYLDGAHGQDEEAEGLADEE